jgi:hypothetical protein
MALKLAEKNAGMTMIGDGSAKCGKPRKCKSGMTWREHLKSKTD